MKFLVVSGLIGSGTSLLAQLAHESGVTMGAVMDFPLYGVQPEWEDRDFSHTLSTWALSGEAADPVFLETYFEDRRVQQGRFAARFSRLGPGVKSPLALVYREAIDEASKRAGVELQWILTERAPEDCWQAILRKVAGMGVHTAYRDALRFQLWALQEKVKESFPIGFDRIPFETLLQEPEKVKRHISERMA